jgi:hypothetical protein
MTRVQKSPNTVAGSAARKVLTAKVKKSKSVSEAKKLAKVAKKKFVKSGKQCAASREIPQITENEAYDFCKKVAEDYFSAGRGYQVPCTADLFYTGFGSHHFEDIDNEWDSQPLPVPRKEYVGIPVGDVLDINMKVCNVLNINIFLNILNFLILSTFLRL